MRVCCLNPQGYVERHPPLGKTDTGGQVVYVLELAKALGRQGIQVDIITRRFDGRPEVERLAPNVRIVRIPCGPSSFVLKEDLAGLMPEFVQGLETFAARHSPRYDVIHSHSWDGRSAGRLLDRR